MKNIRYDGKTRKTLFWICLITGIFGSHYFYLNQKKLGFITIGISWLSTSIATLIWVIYGSVEVASDFNYAGFIVVPTVISLIPLMIVFAWSIYLSVKIALGSYLDENKKRVDSWTSTEQEVLNYYLKL